MILMFICDIIVFACSLEYPKSFFVFNWMFLVLKSHFPEFENVVKMRARLRSSFSMLMHLGNLENLSCARSRSIIEHARAQVKQFGTVHGRAARSTVIHQVWDRILF